ncbi:hypothetical protein ACFFWD_40165 [Bradyrhizobium erythrophlei]|uniref:hypothetical protein n=1 Tax=Bradyrhizobium erythrophlei TaxID=1437360 RepID=UPI0035EB28BB
MNAIVIKRKRREINESDRFSAAHNGLAAGSIQAELATESIAGQSLLVTVPQSRPKYGRQSYRLLAASTSAGEAVPGSFPFFFAAASNCTTSL